jgi:leucine dehydrogenase
LQPQGITSLAKKLMGETMFSHPDFDRHERLVFARDADAGLSAIVAIHSTALGPAFGGCRMLPYKDDAEAITDVLRLSRSMSSKAAICDLPLGGGKSVILGCPSTLKTPDLLRAMGRLVDSLQGRYIVADDVGITLKDLAIMQEETSYSAATTPSSRENVPVTAWGVFCALRSAVMHYFRQDHIRNLTVGVQGLGVVGFPLCDYLSKAGAQLIVADLDRTRVELAVRTFGAVPVSPDAIYDQQMDIFAPCALGGVINAQTAKRLKAKVICGGANNQLASPCLAFELGRRDIVYIPDYLANAGGVIDFALERANMESQSILREVERIGSIVADVLSEVRDGQLLPLEICDRRVKEKLCLAGRSAT